MPRKKIEYFDLTDGLETLSSRLAHQALEPNIYGYVPHLKQLKFHSCDNGEVTPRDDNGRLGDWSGDPIESKRGIPKVRFYVGGNRSGKTVGGIVEDIWWVTKQHPYIDVNKIWPEPIRGRICTTDFVNGSEGIIIPALKRWTPASAFRGGSWETAWDAEKRTVHFANKGFIELRSYDQQLDKHAGTSRHFVHFDEEPPEDIFNENMARLTDTGGRAWFTMTPVEGMTWSYDRLYEPGMQGSSPFSTLIVIVSIKDNPWIDDEEVAVLTAIYSDDEGEASTRIHGEYVPRTGLIYPEFKKEVHVVRHIQNEIPNLDDALVIASLDHGHANATAWLWHVITPSTRIITFWEWYKSGLVVREHAQKVLEINKRIGREPDIYVGDPSIRNTDPIKGTSILEEYAKFGILIDASPGLNDVQAGIDRVKAFMKPIWKDPVDGKLRSLWCVYERCEKLIWELGRYRWGEWVKKGSAREHNKKEQPRKKDDHACDSLRYMAMSQPNFEVLVKELVTVRSPIPRSPVAASKIYAKPQNDIDRNIRVPANVKAGGWGEYDNFGNAAQPTQWNEERYGEW